MRRIGSTAVMGRAVYVPAPIVVTALRWMGRGIVRTVRWWWSGWRMMMGHGFGPDHPIGRRTGGGEERREG